MFSDQEEPKSLCPISTDLSLRTGSSSNNINYVPSKLNKRQRSVVDDGNISIFGSEAKGLSLSLSSSSSSSSSRNPINNYHQFVDGFSSSSMRGGYGGYNHQSVLYGLSSNYGSSSASDKIRHRMIKNRESAARSRSRKQALEAQQQYENTELKKENDLLKRIVRFLLALVRTKSMKLPKLSRSYSAPF